jgi:FixJ family two-component response regulator
MQWGSLWVTHKELLMYVSASHNNRSRADTAVPMTMSDAKPAIIIVDDDISIRESLAPLLKLRSFEVYCFTSATDFLAWPAPPSPRCLLLDVSLPDLSGLDLQVRIAEQRAEMPIIFMTGFGDVPMTVRAMKAGASEFLTKPLDVEVLLAAVDEAIEQSASALRERAAMGALEARYRSLTRREREVFRLIIAGLLNKQVGGELGISEITVKAHRGRVMEKMRASSFAELIRMGEALGSTDLPS